ncbi:hypothetical protein [Candidatus Thiodiazotropha sp. CDECU1]|uniref:hypothetical protein n=1 Tax=Candidatus Thiodiazotropha sp. CDECU1 TaxID=3065865 RepID=UPI00293016E1|nr:hypothetical protein [Candidatus Thiodiazotropha sp. CDECU1]
MEMGSIESIFKEISDHDAPADLKIKLYDNNFQKWTLIISSGSFIVALFIALLTANIEIEGERQKLTVLVLIVISQIGAILYLLAIPIEAIKIARKPSKHFLEPVGTSTNKDFKLAQSLSRYEESLLVNVLKRLQLETAQMRGRVALLVGAIEKVGIIPVSVATLVALYKYFDGSKTNFEWIDHVAFGLMFLYLVMFFIVLFVHRLERYVLIAETALNIKAPERSETGNQ